MSNNSSSCWSCCFWGWRFTILIIIVAVGTLRLIFNNNDYDKTDDKTKDSVGNVDKEGVVDISQCRGYRFSLIDSIDSFNQTDYRGAKTGGADEPWYLNPCVLGVSATIVLAALGYWKREVIVNTCTAPSVVRRTSTRNDLLIEMTEAGERKVRRTNS